MPQPNIFAAIPELTEGEHFDELQRCRNIKVERIISSNLVEPKLYIQKQDEWVILLQGKARLDVDGKERELNPGDFLFIPAGTPHQVLHTSEKPQCIWLAIHIFPNDIDT